MVCGAGLCRGREQSTKFAPAKLTASYSFSWNSQPEQEIKMPPGVPRSRSFTRFTMRVGLPHFGQSVLFVVSIIFLRSAVFAIFAMSLLAISAILSHQRAFEPGLVRVTDVGASF